MDDILVKSKEEITHAKDLVVCYNIMRRFNLQLHSKKCVFAVKGGKLLGSMVTQRGIEPNPEKVQVILDMQPPISINKL